MKFQKAPLFNPHSWKATSHYFLLAKKKKKAKWVIPVAFFLS